MNLLRIGMIRAPLSPVSLVRQRTFVTPLQRLIKESVRFNSTKQIQTFIPGERELKNDWGSRLPGLNIRKETIPTLLPRPGVPQVGPEMSFNRMIQILKNKTEPELIYESEPHKLYFVFCYCIALVAAVYGLTFLEWAGNSAYTIYQANEEGRSEMNNLLTFVARMVVNLAIFAIPATLAFFMVSLPSRLIRRMYYLPGVVEHVKIISHPVLPGRPTPVYTIPLENLTRSFKSKVWTGRGFYGTIDKSTFSYFIKEKGTRFPWIVDRKGFFWGDGRVHDFLFGKETIGEAERGISYDDKFAFVNKKRQLDKQELRKQLGPGWRIKAQGQLLAKDLKTLKRGVKEKDGLVGDEKSQVERIIEGKGKK